MATEYDMKYYLIALTEEEYRTGVNGWDLVRKSDIIEKKLKAKKEAEEAAKKSNLQIAVRNGVQQDGKASQEETKEEEEKSRLIEFEDLLEINTYDRGTSMMVYNDDVYLIFKDYLDLSNNRRIYFGRPSPFGCDQRSEETMIKEEESD